MLLLVTKTTCLPGFLVSYIPSTGLMWTGILDNSRTILAQELESFDSPGETVITGPKHAYKPDMSVIVSQDSFGGRPMRGQSSSKGWRLWQRTVAVEEEYL